MIKRYLPWMVLALAALWLVSNWIPPKVAEGDFDMAAFGRIPVQAEGRVKPLDTVGRNTLVIIHGRQTLRMENGKTLDATRWLADLLFKSAQADKYPVFVINNPDVLGLFGWEQKDKKYFSFEELGPFLKKIDEQGEQAEKIESAQRTPYQTAVINLRNALIQYQRVKNSLRPEDADDFTREIEAYAQAIPAGVDATLKKQKGETFDKETFDAFSAFAMRYDEMSEMAYIFAVPPEQDDTGVHGEWLPVGASLLRSMTAGKINPVVKAYASIGDAYANGDAALFNQQVRDLGDWMKARQPQATGRAGYEYLFNFLAPFYQSMGLYVLVFLLVCGSWLGWTRSLNKSATLVLLLALAVHTFGLASRMYIQERPPVTNLYSSAIFIGFGTVILGLILDRLYRDGIGLAVASVIGFITLIIAHHLAASGDTMGMLQAVLDTNIWLATHVVVITIGYTAMFFAGMLAIFYVVRGVFTSSLPKELARSVARMVYGVTCFATLFSFVGTVLGGIWADQSWGRFWGWDPKENGALLIVLWCAITLHARWGGYIRERGLIIMALFGNVVTSFSWFGVNMLGVGLHSYGWMDKAMPWLLGFMMSQLALMAVAALPNEYWRSFQQHNAISPASEISTPETVARL